jgi:hypothetical protein
MICLSSSQKLSWTARYCLFWPRKITKLSFSLRSQDIMYDDLVFGNYVSTLLHFSPKTPQDVIHVFLCL